MTHQRNPRVHLEADEPRCAPSTECPQRCACARYLAPLPPAGAALIDGTKHAMFSVFCPSYLSLDTARNRKAAADKLAARPKVHPAW